MTRETDAAFSRPVSEVPESGIYDAIHAAPQTGLTKLEYFTAAALTGILAADSEGYMSEEKAARLAVKSARAVIAELNAGAEA